jgi:putative RNA 2'-phosphotransferase
MERNLMHRKDLQRFAKFLSYVLGFRPDEFGLVPDPEGFVTFKELLQALREEPDWRFLGQGHLLEVMHGPDREQFEWVADRIRARAPTASLSPEPVGSPPPRLFHAIRRRAHPVAMRHGLRPAKGLWVVLAVTREMATRLGKRRDPDPVVLEVKAGEAARSGVRFYETQGVLFLAESVPPDVLLGPPVVEEVPERTPRKTEPEKPAELPGSFFVDAQRDLARGKGPRPREKDPAWRRERKRRERG